MATALATRTASPKAAPIRGPPRMAADTTALVAHSVVGNDWFDAAQSAEAMNLVATISAHTTTSSIPTQSHRRPVPLR